MTTISPGWICSSVIIAISELPCLRNVCFDSLRIRLFYGSEEHHSRKLYPHTCWGTKRVNREGLSLNNHYTVKDIERIKQKQTHTTPETKILNCLRELTFRSNFTDLAWMSEAKELMDPLLYHEYKCRPGLFYNSGEDSEFDSDASDENCSKLFRDCRGVIEIMEDSSDTSDSDGFF